MANDKRSIPNGAAWRAAAAAIVMPLGAFLRWDRGEALLISDIPRRSDHPETVYKRLSEAGFDVRVAQQLAYLTPRLPGFSRTAQTLWMARCKGDPSFDRRVRQALAVALRQHDAYEIQTLTALMESSSK